MGVNDPGRLSRQSAVKLYLRHCPRDRALYSVSLTMAPRVLGQVFLNNGADFERAIIRSKRILGCNRTLYRMRDRFFVDDFGALDFEDVFSELITIAPESSMEAVHRLPGLRPGGLYLLRQFRNLLLSTRALSTIHLSQISMNVFDWALNKGFPSYQLQENYFLAAARRMSVNPSQAVQSFLALENRLSNCGTSIQCEQRVLSHAAQ